MNQRPIALLGAGGHARVASEALRLIRTPVAGYLAPEPSQTSADLGPYLGNDENLAKLASKMDFVLGVGFVNGFGIQRRQQLLSHLAELGACLRTVVHPHAFVSPSARLEAGVFVAMGAMVGVNSYVGRAAIVNSGAIVDHDSRLGANSHIATGARLAGGVTIGENVLIGIGSIVREGQSVHDNAVVAAGAVVVQDVPTGVTVMGTPAKSKT